MTNENLKFEKIALSKAFNKYVVNAIIKNT